MIPARPLPNCAALLVAAAALIFSGAASGQTEEGSGLQPPPTPETHPAPTEPAAEPSAGLQAPPPPDTAPDEQSLTWKEPEDEDHHGFFFRLGLGLGYGWLLGSGTMPPAKGLPRTGDLEHHSPLFNIELLMGGGFSDLGLHAGLLYERMFLRTGPPYVMSVTLFGLGVGATYYLIDDDLYLTAQLRMIAMSSFRPEVDCDHYLADKYTGFGGVGGGVTLGKEWFDDQKDVGVGIGLQTNYAWLTHDKGTKFHYVSVLLALTLTVF